VEGKTAYSYEPSAEEKAWMADFLGMDNPFFAENNGDQSDTLRAGTLSLLHLSCQR